MKKLLIILFLFACGVIQAQDIPSKMLKGIEVKQDEFTGEKTYRSKNGELLSITQKGSEYSLMIKLQIKSFDNLKGLKKIYILTNGNVTEVERNSDFSEKEEPTRYIAQQASGNFGTSSYKPAVWDTRMMYVETWETSATPYIDIVESIANNGGKFKFECQNGEFVQEVKDKEQKGVQSILTLYKFLQGK